MDTDRISEIIERAINYTEDILKRAPKHLGIARDELERMRQNLKNGADDHPALQRLEGYIDELRRRFPN